MTISETFHIAVLLLIVVGVIIGHFVETRRNRSVEDLERMRRERKAEVERAARKSR
jgi:flagellar biosynthesis/type III secretory pathway M-ring protein FliF/YscJ